MRRSLNLRIKPYIQPFERRLAILEMERLAHVKLSTSDACAADRFHYSITTSVPAEVLADRATYWEAVRGDSGSLVTRQVAREASVHVAQNGKNLEEIVSLNGHAIQMPTRRCLRYATHGIHEYRGKFFPQLVRSLLNISDIPSEARIGDPMCGSGTTAVEAVLAGHTAQALDMNPLSAFITRTKCEMLFVRPRRLANALASLRAALDRRRPRRVMPYFDGLPEADQEYLRKWFAIDALHALDVVSCAIAQIRGPVIRDFFRASQSNVLRRISWQKEDDLRVRREKIRDPSFEEVIQAFLAEAERNAKHVVAFLKQEAGSIGNCIVNAGDARQVDKIWPEPCDAVVTSPPYATALPYLDTDRLSLIYLGLLPKSSIRARDQLMIGNREISERNRRDLWQEFQSGLRRLPDEVVNLIHRIHELNSLDPSAGFRRRNLPPLLYQYFRDMSDSLCALSRCVRHNGDVFVVVGDNRTVANGKTVRIPTTRFLQTVAENSGFTTVDVVPMEMLVNREIHRRNATQSESIIWLRNRSQ